MAQGAATRVNADQHLVGEEAKRVSLLLGVDLIHNLHLAVVVARTQSTYLLELTLLGLLRDLGGIGALQASAIFDVLQILCQSVAALNGESGSMEFCEPG